MREIKSQRKDLSNLEILKTARDMWKAYVRSDPDSIAGSDPESLLELHRKFVEGLTKQTDDLLAEPAPPEFRFTLKTRENSKEHP